MSNPQAAPPHPEMNFAAKVLLAVVVGVLLLTFWRLAQVFLIGFGGIVVAVALNNMAGPLSRKTGLSDNVALGITTVGLVVFTFGFLALFGAGASAQFAALIDRLPAAWEAARTWILSWPVGPDLIEAAENSGAQAATTLLSVLPIAGDSSAAWPTPP